MKDDKMKQVDKDLFQSSGGELMVQAAYDWKEQCSDDEPFSEWFEESQWIDPHKQYRYDDELSGIEEVEDE